MSEQRLIDANALKKRIINFCGCVPYVEERKGGSHGILYLNEAIDSAPTVPAEVVVHCRDCKQWRSSWGEYGDCHQWNIGYDGEHAETASDDYCSYGERREDGKT